jgi:two-component system, OmpR family, sensor histidine kinase CiaH
MTRASGKIPPIMKLPLLQRIGSMQPGSRLLVFGVLAIVAFTIAQLSWWVIFHLRSSAQEIIATAQHLETNRLAAERTLVALEKRQVLGPGGPAEFIRLAYPQLVWQAIPGQTILPTFPGYGVTIRPGRVEHLIAQRQASIRMFTAEGATFLCILLAGAAIILRSVRREMQLMRQQANFLSAVTHELKSPLASIRLFIETLEMRDLTPEKRSRYLSNMHADVDRLEGLVNNILAVARLDSRRFVVHVDEGDLARDVADVVTALGKDPSQRRLKVDLSVPDGPLPARYDLGVLKTVLRNLLDNAAKYGGADKPVHIAVARHEDWATIEVADQGIGLAAEEQEKIFQKFYRVGDEMVRQAEGSGLGLYLSRELLRQSGGTLTVESPGVGCGTTFRVSLPAAKRATA